MTIMGEFTQLVKTVFTLLSNGIIFLMAQIKVSTKKNLKIGGFHIPFGAVSWTLFCSGYAVI
jgi:hypothetical protein